MQLSHSLSTVSVRFDDPNLIGSVGLAPVMALADRCGLNAAVGSLTVPSPNAGLKTTTVLAGMLSGADSIDDLDRLRHGGMGRLFTEMRAPSTLGTFLRSFRFGHVRQLDKIAADLLVKLTCHTPVLPDADRVCFVDVDDTVKQTYGYAKQGVGYGYSHVKGLNGLVGTLSTPLSAPVIAATRLRAGPTNSARGAASFITSTLSIARRCGGTGLVVARADSAFFTSAVVDAIRRAGARFSITARLNSSVQKAIAAIDDDAWAPIRYPNAVFDEQAGRWVSDAEVAEIDYTAFTSKPRSKPGKQSSSKPVTARLIVRRVKLLPNASQPVLIPGWRYHAVFTDTPMPLLQAETCHRQHAVIEQTMADLKNGPLAHLPSGRFPANAAWLTLAGMAHNLTRAAGALASVFHATARPATIRDQLINIPARIATSARRLTLHLPTDWRWEHAWQALIAAVG